MSIQNGQPQEELQRLTQGEREVKMTDFDGFKVMEKKKLMSRIIKNEAKILQKKKKKRGNAGSFSWTPPPP